jgi:hypothetical protein
MVGFVLKITIACYFPIFELGGKFYLEFLGRQLLLTP